MGIVLFVLALGMTLFVHALIIIMSRDKSEDFSVRTVIVTVLADSMILIWFSVSWIIFVEVYKAFL